MINFLADLAERGREAKPRSTGRTNGRNGKREACGDADKTMRRPWPDPPDGAAYYGMAGDIVGMIEPHTEADPAALLIQLLVGFGNTVHRAPHFMAEADRHGMNLFAVLVGETSKGRKGASWGHIRRLMHAVDEGWADERIMGGLSSGEGLIWAVRDPIYKTEPIKEKGVVVDYQEVMTDAGVKDKRLFVIEPEFASVLKVMSRESNTLSAIIRHAWDRGNLRTMTKNSPAKATGAHISIVGHITSDELRTYLTRTESANGFGNRFLWVCVRRSKYLPEGGGLSKVNSTSIINRLREAVGFARKTNEIVRDDVARQLWWDVYPVLSDGKPGLLGAVTGRSEAQTARLACLYALLDCSAVVRVEHLRAALAVWDYCERSAAYVFDPAGTAEENPQDQTRRKLLELIQRKGGTVAPRDVRGQFDGDTEQAETALSRLVSDGKGAWNVTHTGGRPKRLFVLKPKEPKPKVRISADSVTSGSGTSGTGSENAKSDDAINAGNRAAEIAVATEREDESWSL